MEGINLVSYICPKCGHKLVIGLEVNVGGVAEHKCPNCGSEMEKEK